MYHMITNEAEIFLNDDTPPIFNHKNLIIIHFLFTTLPVKNICDSIIGDNIISKCIFIYLYCIYTKVKDSACYSHQTLIVYAINKLFQLTLLLFLAAKSSFRATQINLISFYFLLVNSRLSNQRKNAFLVPYLHSFLHLGARNRR